MIKEFIEQRKLDIKLFKKWLCVYAKYVLALSIFLKVVDVATTWWAVSEVGSDVEANLLVRACMNKIGLIPTLVINLIICCVALVMLYIKGKKTQNHILLFICLFFLYVVAINNMIHILFIF